MREILGDLAEVLHASGGARAEELLEGAGPKVLVVASELSDMSGAAFLQAQGPALLERGGAALFLEDPASSAPIPDDESVYYLLRLDMSAADVRALLASALATRDTGEAGPSPEEAAKIRRLLEVPRLFAQQHDLKGASRVANRAVLEFLAAERARCLFYDADGGTLWAESTDGGEDQDEPMPARLGLAGFAARTGQPVCVDRADRDPRYRREVDDPGGRGDEHLLAQPIADRDGQVHAVLVAARPEGAAAFSPEDRSVAARIAHHLGPLTGQLALGLEAETVLEEAAAQERLLFRPEAIAAYGSLTRRGDVVRVSPAWVSWCYWLVVALVAAVAAFIALGRLSEYSQGPAVVYQTGRTDVVSPVVGTLVSLHVGPGDQVEVGQILARFHAPDEAAELTRLDREWQDRVRDYLASPANPEVRGSLVALRAQRDRLAERLSTRAEHAGVVTDVRVAPGQRVVLGQTLLSLGRADGELRVVALLPGGDRPQLRPGMDMRLELDGYRYAYQELEVGSIASEVIGPGEAGRYLGSPLADSLVLAGPIVIVTARLNRTTFEVDGQNYAYHHGMQGVAEVRVRTTSVLRALLPGRR